MEDEKALVVIESDQKQGKKKRKKYPVHRKGKAGRPFKHETLEKRANEAEGVIQRADDLNAVARESLGKSQLAIFRYATQSYERLATLTKTRQDLEETMFSPEMLQTLKTIATEQKDLGPITAYWEIMEKSINESVKNLQDINRMAQGYELLKAMIDKFGNQQSFKDKTSVEHSATIKDLLENKFKEVFNAPASVTVH